MARLGFVSCSKTKGTHASPAAALYTSPLFRKSLLAAIDRTERVFILSAKHGVVGCNDLIPPYDVTLKTMKRAERMAWGERTGVHLANVLNAGDVAELYCGEEYMAPLRTSFEELQVEVEHPLGSFSLGSRLSLLGTMNEEAELRAVAARFVRLMSQVWAAQGGGRPFRETNGKQPWPKRGVYFILGNTTFTRGRMPRIVRVGTHAVSQGSKTSLWDRLSTHRGTIAGGGSHRSSIFRLHLGRAWARRAVDEDWPKTWAQGQSAPADIRLEEQALEQQVSKLIGAMNVVWLDIDDEAGPGSERAYIERNAIGLLSRIGLLKASAESDWLGWYSTDWRISASGLWNLNHVFKKPDSDFIDRLTVAVARTIGRQPRVDPIEITKGKEQDQFSFLPGDGQ